MAEDEYYVLIIHHQQGKDFTWTKRTTYDASHDSRDVRGGKQWLSEPNIGPHLDWQVVVARAPIEDPNDAGDNGADPTGFERSKYSETRRFHWYAPPEVVTATPTEVPTVTPIATVPGPNP